MKQQTIDHILEVEGGYVDDPADSGGETNFGVTIATAAAYGYTGAMRDLPREIAFEIYADKWDGIRADHLAQLSEAVTTEVMDTAINMGSARAGKFLQRVLNVLNKGGTLYPDLTVDGGIGPVTVNALGTYLRHRSEITLVRALNCLQGAFYIELAERREKDETFVYGWLKNRVKL